VRAGSGQTLKFSGLVDTQYFGLILSIAFACIQNIAFSGINDAFLIIGQTGFVQIAFAHQYASSQFFP
jgi:hypothetical protein